MPLIVTPTEAAALIGGKCGGSSPDFDDPGLLSILETFTTKLTAAMDVTSLSRGTHLDRFYLNEKPASTPRGPNTVRVRLSNAYLVADSLIYRDEDGEELEAPTAEKIDLVYGVVEIADWSRGYYSLEYQSGFEVVENSDPAIYAGTPDWMKPVISAYLVSWYRTMFLSPRVPKNISYEQLMAALYREIQGLIYSQYQRPRLDVVWSDARS